MSDLIQGWDLSFLSWMRGYHAPILLFVAFVISTVAWKGWLWWLMIAGSWLKGKRLIAMEIASALAIATAAGLPMKSLVARARPDLYASTQLNIPMPELLSTTHSFPSGHTLLAAAFAFVVFFRYKDWRAVASFVFVALVGLARIYQGMHWPSDIVGSIVLGFIAALAARFVVKLPPLARFSEEKSSNISDAASRRKIPATTDGGARR